MQAQKNNNKECEAIDKIAYYDPTLCCKYPTVEFSAQVMESCGVECESDEGKGTCCMNFCVTRKSGILVDEKFHPGKLIAAFKWPDTKKELSKKWKIIVTEAVTECQDECETLIMFK